ncbi:MAG: acyltransferase [Proteobacteria bacterium]|nr:acyltransferase [Pseudomonadota bacterium]
MTTKRLPFIDGLRGIAVLAIVLFHAFARWPELYPYGYQFADLPFLNTRTAGVNLFFMISGFVILMSLRRCQGYWDFLERRWLRLFPAMLLCSLLIIGTAFFLPERPAGAVRCWDILPGLTLIGDQGLVRPLWVSLSQLIGYIPHSLEGVFWSLYIEVKFYILFGGAFFLLGERRAIATLLLLFALNRVVLDPTLNAPLHRFLIAARFDEVATFFRFDTYGFFAAGALLCLAHDTSRKFFLLAAIAIGSISILSLPNLWLVNLVFLALICGAVASSRLQQILANRLLLFLGFVSYPLYLLHENIMVALIIKLGRVAPNLSDVLLPVLPIMGVIGLAWLIASFGEPALKRALAIKPFKTPSTASQAG